MGTRRGVAFREETVRKYVEAAGGDLAQVLTNVTPKQAMQYWVWYLDDIREELWRQKITAHPDVRPFLTYRQAHRHGFTTSGIKRPK